MDYLIKQQPVTPTWQQTPAKENEVLCKNRLLTHSGVFWSVWADLASRWGGWHRKVNMAASSAEPDVAGVDTWTQRCRDGRPRWAHWGPLWSKLPRQMRWRVPQKMVTEASEGRRGSHWAPRPENHRHASSGASEGDRTVTQSQLFLLDNSFCSRASAG